MSKCRFDIARSGDTADRTAVDGCIRMRNVVWLVRLASLCGLADLKRVDALAYKASLKL